MNFNKEFKTIAQDKVCKTHDTLASLAEEML